MPHSTREYLQHILDEINYLLEASDGLSRKTFLQDGTLRRAFVRSVKVIEATKQVPDALRKQYPQIKWRAMAGMRDHLIHEYFGVDYDIVWDVVVNEIPRLARHVERVLDEMLDDGTVGE